MAVFTRTTITGREHVPATGPLIAVGNHVAAMEVALMMLALNRHVEFLGASDVPPPPFLDLLTRLYGYIPVYRGKMDRTAMEQALSVLDQGGVLGIFPEGGIWRTGHKAAQKGVSWLSYRAQAPILPMGFGGMTGALAAMTRLQRPRVTVRIGSPLAPVRLRAGRSRRAQFDEAAQRILASIVALLPPADRPRAVDVGEETFAIEVVARDRQGSQVTVPQELAVEHGPSLSRLLYHPALIVTFRDRLHLPVQPFEHLDAEPDPALVARAAGSVLAYLEDENPYFLTYRFGNREGGAMREGLRELNKLAAWATAQRLELSVIPVRRYRSDRTAEWAEQRSVGDPHAW
jgi:1-acyl-sn-glycerol-3-phosphate acyltransferase